MNSAALKATPRPDSLPVPQALDPDIEERVQEFTQSCDNGRGPPVACHSLAQFQSVVMQDYRYAAELFERACFINKDKGEQVNKRSEMFIHYTLC